MIVNATVFAAALFGAAPPDPPVQASSAYGTVVAQRQLALAGRGADHWTLDVSGPGRFVVRGVCGASCTDVDLQVRNEGGVTIDDHRNYSVPARVTLPGAGRYVVSTYMSSCPVASCGASLTVTREAAPGGAAALTVSEARAAERDVAERLEEATSFIAGDGVAPWVQWRHTLVTGESDIWWQSLSPDRTYLVAGVCDRNCDTLELVAENAAGVVVSRDETFVDFPMILVTGQSQIKVKATMTSCSASACAAGFILYDVRE